jgi:hypothetical protein
VLTGTIIQDHYLPFFEHGLPDSFFADGVSIGNCYEVDDVRYMLFMGWQNPQNKHWRGDIGTLIVHPNLTLSLDHPTPFLASNAEDPLKFALILG